MTVVTVTTWVKVAGGPDLSTSRPIDAEVVVQSSVLLDAAGGGGAERTVELMPGDGSVVLLALAASTASGAQATITATPRNGAESGTALTIEGALVAANPGICAALVKGGPRTLTLKNSASEPVTVDLIAARTG